MARDLVDTIEVFLHRTERPRSHEAYHNVPNHASMVDVQDTPRNRPASYLPIHEIAIPLLLHNCHIRHLRTSPTANTGISPRRSSVLHSLRHMPTSNTYSMHLPTPKIPTYSFSPKLPLTVSPRSCQELCRTHPILSRLIVPNDERKTPPSHPPIEVTPPK